jgi:hypothetical protein
LSDAAPALVAVQGKLLLVHKGEALSKLWQSWWTPSGTSGAWSDNVEIANHASDATPALAVLTDQVHLVHKGTETNKLWHSWTQGA